MMRGAGLFGGYGGGGLGGFGGHMGFAGGAVGANGLWLPLIIAGAIKLILLIAVVFVIYRLLKKRGHIGQYHDAALELLKQRYAQGEIDSEEFANRKKLLS